MNLEVACQMKFFSQVSKISYFAKKPKTTLFVIGSPIDPEAILHAFTSLPTLPIGRSGRRAYYQKVIISYKMTTWKNVDEISKEELFVCLDATLGWLGKGEAGFMSFYAIIMYTAGMSTLATQCLPSELALRWALWVVIDTRKCLISEAI